LTTLCGLDVVDADLFGIDGELTLGGTWNTACPRMSTAWLRTSGAATGMCIEASRPICIRRTPCAA